MEPADRSNPEERGEIMELMTEYSQLGESEHQLHWALVSLSALGESDPPVMIHVGSCEAGRLVGRAEDRRILAQKQKLRRSLPF